MTTRRRLVAIVLAILLLAAVVVLMLNDAVADGTSSRVGPFPTGDGDQVEVTP